LLYGESLYSLCERNAAPFVFQPVSEKGTRAHNLGDKFSMALFVKDLLDHTFATPELNVFLDHHNLALLRVWSGPGLRTRMGL